MSTGVRPAAGIEPVDTGSVERARFVLTSVSVRAGKEPIDSIDRGSVPLQWPLPWNYPSARRRAAAWSIDSAIMVLLWMTELLVFTLF